MLTFWHHQYSQSYYTSAVDVENVATYLLSDVTRVAIKYSIQLW